MKGFPVLLATLLLSGALALAQAYTPGTVTGTVPTVVYPLGSTMPVATTGVVSSDTNSILNGLAAVQGQIYASQLVSQGQMLTSRMNALMAQEMQFRQALAANPNLPNAQITALQLTAEANGLNQDIAAYNTTVSMVPVALRPYLAQQMNTFDVAYWQPTVQRFSTYTASLPQTTITYQPAFAANPWLQPWLMNYQASVTALSQTQPVFASVRWWTTTAAVPPTTTVLGTTEVFPTTGGYYMLPNGAVVYIPPSTAATTGMMVAPSMTGTPGMTVTNPNLNGY